MELLFRHGLISRRVFSIEQKDQEANDFFACWSFGVNLRSVYLMYRVLLLSYEYAIRRYDPAAHVFIYIYIYNMSIFVFVVSRRRFRIFSFCRELRRHEGGGGGGWEAAERCLDHHKRTRSKTKQLNYAAGLLAVFCFVSAMKRGLSCDAWVNSHACITQEIKIRCVFTASSWTREFAKFVWYGSKQVVYRHTRTYIGSRRQYHIYRGDTASGSNDVAIYSIH